MLPLGAASNPPSLQSWARAFEAGLNLWAVVNVAMYVDVLLLCFVNVCTASSQTRLTVIFCCTTEQKED